jgi:hypothetical protein
LRSVDSSRDRFEENDSKVRSSNPNSLKVLLGRKKQLDRSRPCLRCLEGAAGPREIARGTEVLPRICRRRCWPERDDFEGPKSYLKYLEGAAGPKGMTSRDQSPTSNISKALLAREKQFEGPGNSLEGKKNRVVEKLDAYSNSTGGKA